MSQPRLGHDVAAREMLDIKFTELDEQTVALRF